MPPGKKTAVCSWRRIWAKTVNISFCERCKACLYILFQGTVERRPLQKELWRNYRVFTDKQIFRPILLHIPDNNYKPQIFVLRYSISLSKSK